MGLRSPAQVAISRGLAVQDNLVGPELEDSPYWGEDTPSGDDSKD